MSISPALPRKPIWPPLERPHIYISYQVKQKLDAYIAVAPGEIAGMGTVSVVGPSRFLIEDVFIFKQLVNQAEAQLDQSDMSAFLLDCMQKGVDTDNVKLQWHSHANIQAFWSQLDLSNIDDFDNGMNDWMLSLVGNKSGQFLGRIDIFHPIRVYMDALPLIPIADPDPELMQVIAAEVADKVKVLPVKKVTYARIKGGKLIGAGGVKNAAKK